MFRYTTTYCKKCHLQEDPFHNIAINEDGLCNLCTSTSAPPVRDWKERKQLFKTTLEKGKGNHAYDGLIMMSGGKDSAYMAHLLTKEYGLNLLAFTIDNGFEYAETFENASIIARKLDLPYMLYRVDPKLMRKYYRFLFCEEKVFQQDCGQVCTFCGRFLIRVATDFAASIGIPFVFSGHNPDQIFLMGESIEDDPKRQTVMEFTMAMLEEETTNAVDAWRRHHRSRTGHNLFPGNLSSDNVSLLFPFQYFPYEPEKMMAKVRKELDWTPIKHFSKTYIASGCKLVKLWAYLARCSTTNNYVDFEFSSQVREGTLARETIESFYTHATVELKELAELAHELDSVEPLRKLLLEKFGPTNELLVLLSK